MSDVQPPTRPRSGLRGSTDAPPRPMAPRPRGSDGDLRADWVKRVLGVTVPPPGQQPQPKSSPKPYRTRRQELEDAQRERSAKALVEAMEFDAKLIDGLPVGTNTDEIRSILSEHAVKVPDETKAFDGLSDFQSIQELAPEKREGRLRGVTSVLSAVKDRRKRLEAAIESAPRPWSEADAQAIGDGRRLLARISAHVPEEFLSLGDQLQDRIATLCASPEEKKQILAREKQGFLNDKGEDITATLGGAFKEVIEPVGMKKFERMNFFFDQFVSAPPVKELDKLGQITTKVVQKCYRIMDAGGDLDDVQALMERTGIPETWWPPAFVETLQAWRKAEREMQKERVSKLMAQSDYDFTSPGDVLKFFQDVAHDAAGEGASDAKKAFARILKTREVSAAIEEFTNSVKSRWGFATETKNCFEALDFSTLDPSLAKQLTDNIISAEKTLTSVISTVSSIGDNKVTKEVLPEVAKLAGELAPGIAIAVAGINLALALAELAEQTAMVVQTGSMKTQARSQLGRRDIQDGGAFVLALNNELGARKTLVAKAGVDVADQGLALTGALIEAGAIHVGGSAVKLGLKVVGKTIKYGANAIFTGIEWAAADRARALLEQAQAGNPVARIQIFEDSPMYAKMYICCLVRDGNPLALRFVEQRGIDESSMTKADSLMVLAEFLMKDAGQRNEQDVPEGFLDAQSGGIIGKVRNYGGKAVDAIGKKAVQTGNAISKSSRKVPYDPDWTFNGPILLTGDAWQGVKDAAYKAGLFDESTGIGAALKKAEPLLAETRKMSTSGGPLDSPEMKQRRTNAMAAMTALAEARAAVWSYAPLANPGKDDKQEPHKGMSLFLVRLSEEITATIDRIEQTLRESGLKNVAWDPKIPSNPLDAVAWQTKWAEGREAACLPAGDAGIGAGLRAAASARSKRDGLDRAKDPQDHRRASVALQEALGETVASCLKGLSLVGDVPAMMRYVEAVRDAAAREARDLDGDLAGDSWQNAPPVDPPERVSAAGWKTMWDAAGNAGMCNRRAGDGGLSGALAALEKQLAVIAKRERDPKKLAKARYDMADACGKVLLAFEAFLRAQDGAADQVTNYAVNIRKRAMAEMTAADTARASVPFSAPQNVSATAWATAYKTAVEAGAVIEANSAASALTKALTDYEKAAQTLAGELRKGASKASRAAALEVQKALVGLTKALNVVMAVNGYSEHPEMGRYLLAVQTKVKEWRTADALSRALKGIDDSAFAPAEFTIDPAPFSKMKADAEKLGIIAPDLKTGMGDALKDAKSALSDYEKKRKGKSSKDREAAEKARLKAREAVTGLKPVVERLAGLSESKKWTDWVAAAANVCEQQLAALAG